jgi:hypothetical protein
MSKEIYEAVVYEARDDVDICAGLACTDAIAERSIVAELMDASSHAVRFLVTAPLFHNGTRVPEKIQR